MLNLCGRIEVAAMFVFCIQWSFGVLLWEFQSLAAMPYGDIDDFEMADYLSEGFRLSQPINCPDSL